MIKSTVLRGTDKKRLRLLQDLLLWHNLDEQLGCTYSRSRGKTRRSLLQRAGRIRSTLPSTTALRRVDEPPRETRLRDRRSSRVVAAIGGDRLPPRHASAAPARPRTVRGP